jgi:membrane-associated protein
VRHDLDQLLAAIGAHPAAAYAAVLLAALLEAVPVLGSFIPGSTVILGLGALAASDQLDLRLMVAAAAAGALLGDGGAYLAGRRGQRRILAAWPLSRAGRLVARSESFFARHGTLAVLLGRFVAPIRALVPVTAGALDMPPRRFWPVELVTVTLWAPLHVMPGAIAADTLRHLDTRGFAHPWLLAAAAVIVALLALSLWCHLRPGEANRAETGQPRGSGPV